MLWLRRLLAGPRERVNVLRDDKRVLNVSQRVLVQQYDIRQFARFSAEKKN
jgi:hypothetical protein